MCSVIGAVINSPSVEDFDMLKRVFLESRIRGMHATGMSFLPSWSSDVQTIKEPIPADAFIEKHLHNDNLKDLVNSDGTLYLIGHCRYSTSDLEYNQPIANKTLSVVHNGVITQELPENWKELYGWDCETKNDTELILHSVSAGKNPLISWKDSSLAVCELHKSKEIRAYRNGKRPLYLTTLKNGCIITSTADIPSRAFVDGETVEIPANTFFNISANGVMMEAVSVPNSTDYQNYELR
jgi:glutamine phosphoribosylpyrophosphate amidotransferase